MRVVAADHQGRCQNLATAAQRIFAGRSGAERCDRGIGRAGVQIGVMHTDLRDASGNRGEMFQV